MRFLRKLHRIALVVYPAISVMLLVVTMFGQDSHLRTEFDEERVMVEHRLSTLEAQMESQTWLLRASVLGIAGLIAEAAFRMKKRPD